MCASMTNTCDRSRVEPGYQEFQSKDIAPTTSADGDVTVRVEEAEGTDLLSGEVRNLNDIYLPPFAVKLFKKNV